jgi:hypothetical protein
MIRWWWLFRKKSFLAKASDRQRSTATTTGHAAGRGEFRYERECLEHHFLIVYQYYGQR